MEESYYDTATIAVVKSFIVQAQGQLKKNHKREGSEFDEKTKYKS